MIRKNLKENSNEFPSFEQFKNLAHRERFSYSTSTSTCKKIYIQPIDFSAPGHVEFFLGVSSKVEEYPSENFVNNSIKYNPVETGFIKDTKNTVLIATYTFYNSTLTFFCDVYNDKGHMIKPTPYDHIMKVKSFTDQQKSFFESLRKDFISSSHELLNSIPELIKQINQADADRRSGQLERDYSGISGGIKVQATEAEKIADIRKRLNEATRLGKQSKLGYAFDIMNVIRKYRSVKILQAYISFRKELQTAEDAGDNEGVKVAYAKFRQEAPQAYDYFLNLLKKENPDYYDYLGVTLGIYDSYTSKHG